MKIISWNVNGIRAAVKKDFFKSIDGLNPDILCLQETKAQDEEVAQALKPLNGYHALYNSADKKGYSGTALLCKSEPLSSQLDMGVAEHDAEGRIQCAEYQEFYLVNVYVPNSGQQLDRLDYRKQWDADFLAYLKRLEEKKPVIACGDFNVAHHPIDLKNDKSNYNKTAGYTQVEIDGMDNKKFANTVQQSTKKSGVLIFPNHTCQSFGIKGCGNGVGPKGPHFPFISTVVKNSILHG